MKDIEIEIQVKVEKPEVVRDFLDKNAEYLGEERQVDEYFSPAHRDFLAEEPIKEWLRLRSGSRGSSLNYKNWHYDGSGESTHCDEFESEINDLDRTKKIFSAIDVKPIVKVDKIRKTWRYKDYEIVMDHIEGLGDFIEIEYKGQGESLDPKKIINKMVLFLKELGCGEVRRNQVGYPFQLLFPDKVDWEIC